ncbi:hypothetical protein KAR91_50685 [Candidatus Pacearchaeota archaeon]|nr:hypothetical protein [Candidatus Pacearchaeota archaeon]
MDNADRQKRYRARKRNAQGQNVTPTVTRVTPEPDRNALIGPDVYYHPRTHPHLMNWGKHMNVQELESAGLKANRVPIPGDWDYEGVAA